MRVPTACAEHDIPKEHLDEARSIPFEGVSGESRFVVIAVKAAERNVGTGKVCRVRRRQELPHVFAQSGSRLSALGFGFRSQITDHALATR